MNINVYGKYKVKYRNKYSYRTFDDFGDIIFKEDKVNYTKTLDGYKVLNIINTAMKYPDIINMSINEDTIHIEQFNSHSGCDEDIYIEIKEKNKIKEK